MPIYYKVTGKDFTNPNNNELFHLSEGAGVKGRNKASQIQADDAAQRKAADQARKLRDVSGKDYSKPDNNELFKTIGK